MKGRLIGKAKPAHTRHFQEPALILLVLLDSSSILASPFFSFHLPLGSLKRPFPSSSSRCYEEPSPGNKKTTGSSPWKRSPSSSFPTSGPSETDFSLQALSLAALLVSCRSCFPMLAAVCRHTAGGVLSSVCAPHQVTRCAAEGTAAGGQCLTQT